MTGFLRRVAAIGLCILVLTGMSSPIASAATSANAPAAATPTSAPAGPGAAPATSPTATSGPPSASYSLVPEQFSLLISPTRLIIGQNDLNKVQKFQVVNRGQLPAPVTVQKRNFLGSADGSLNYQDSAPYAASTWVTVTPMSFIVAPGATQVVTATIKTPAKPDFGDHQVAVVFLVPAGKTSANIKINRGIATPMYITVPGPTSNTASITDLSAPGFAQGGPVTLTAKVHNTGTVHRDFRGATFLSVSGPGTAVPFPDFTVPRGATRDISTTWTPPLICICHPKVQFVNADGASQSVSVRVIIFPVRLLLIVLVVLLLLVLAVRISRRRYRKSIQKAAAALTGAAATGNA